ncbi:MAG: peptide ABC transporter substrate-binding protein, partial [Anaerolineales bacterium]
MPTERLIQVVLALMAGIMLLSGCRGKAQESVTLSSWDKFDLPTLDPQVAFDITSIDAIESLFLHLTNYDLETTQIVPEAATGWHVSDDGLIYTFSIRTDIPWVKHDPDTGKTTQELDAQGQPRFLSAHDFVYGIKRACDPHTGAYYSTVIAPLLKGCSDVLFADDPDRIPPQLWDAIGVHASAHDTLVIELEFPASYFLSMTPMWTLAAVPHWAIEAHGKAWIEPDHIVTNGRFVLHEWKQDISRTFLRNPLLPQDLYGTGNIERFTITVVPDYESGYSLWLEDQVDYSYIPPDQVQAHLEQFPDETDLIPDLAVTYISFRMTKPPFDDPRVRRAFSAAFDRETYVAEVLQGQGLPMIHFAPPGIFGAPPIDQVGLGFDPDFARQQLAEAGYPACQGLPPVTLAGYSENKELLAKFARAQWIEHLGCSPNRVLTKEMAFGDLLGATEPDAPDDRAPHMWPLGWASDYADENNWVGDVLWCKQVSREKRTCNETDDLIVQARQEPDPQRRIELYRQIEEMFFGPQGEIPFFPVAMRTTVVARHTWLDRTPARFGGEQWYNWSIDQQAQRAA